MRRGFEHLNLAGYPLGGATIPAMAGSGVEPGNCGNVFLQKGHPFPGLAGAIGMESPSGGPGIAEDEDFRVLFGAALKQFIQFFRVQVCGVAKQQSRFLGGLELVRQVAEPEYFGAVVSAAASGGGGKLAC